MKTDARRVYVFIAIGLLSAVFVGLGVWKISAPGPIHGEEPKRINDPSGPHRINPSGDYADHNEQPHIQARSQEELCCSSE